MQPRPPVQSLRQTLPFHDPAFGWDTFEDFFCDFLNLQPVIILNDGGTEIRRRVIRARPFGRKGDSQNGIDLLAEMEGGEVWDFQCKHYKTWGPQDTRDAITAYERNASRRFLLITREVSEECHKLSAEHPGWVLWDAREINQQFRQLEAHKAARILFTHFGPGWAEAFFGMPGDGPLIGAGAKFERQLREGFRFHHRHALIGRAELLKQLDDFIHGDARVFILPGRGGLGKSRLLLEWSRNFNQRHPDQTLRFLSDKCIDFGPSLQAAPQPLTLVFDDAHRLDDVRRALFHELPRREHIRLVLALRPGPTGQVVQELISAGFDTTEIETAEPMEPLTAEQAMALVDAALKPEFSQYRHFLRAASRKCPLIAVIGAELINSHTLTSRDLLDEKELRHRVFESLLGDAAPVREKFGAQATDDFLRLLSLLGPVRLDKTFFENAAPFLGLSQADRVSHLRDALDHAGLLHTTGAGTRVTPDLLSDHLAYTACYDHAGQSRTFAERLLAHFSPDEFPKLLQHLAAAEWRALDEIPGAASVVEPLWKWFRERFEKSSFDDRSTQIQVWANIAYLQPERSLELAELAVSLTSAPASANEWLVGHEWDTHEHSLQWLPKMLAGVAEHHSDKLSRCLDLLWQLGRDKTAGSHNDQSHPISLINDIVAFKHWKRLDVQVKALDWIERLLAGDDWLRHLHKPGWLLGKFFKPIFATSVEENWSTGRTIHTRSHPLHLTNTAPLRERIRATCRKLLARRDPHLTSQLIPVLDEGCDIARLGFGGLPSQEFIDTWDAERMKSLALLEEASRDFDEPLIHFQIRRTLIRHLRYGKDSSEFRVACRKIVLAIPDTLNFRIARTAFGNDYDEFERDVEDIDWRKKAKARWESFLGEVADTTHDTYPTPAALLRHFAELDSRWCGFGGFQPNFRDLLTALVERHPAEGVAAAELLLAQPTHPLAHTFDVLVLFATKNDLVSRLRLIRTAALSSSETLRAAAVACCTWWRREESLPEEAWQILESLAPMATPLVAHNIGNFVWWNNKQGSLRDWNLVTAVPFTPSEIILAGHIAIQAARLVAECGIKPDAQSVQLFLRRFETLSEPKGHDFEEAFEKLAEAFPVEMFLVLWRRNQARKAGNTSLQPLPYDFEPICFPQIMDAPEVQAIVAETEQRLTAEGELDPEEMRLLRSAILHGSEQPSAWLEAAAVRATTKEQLDRLRELGSVGGHENAALAYPDFARVLLIRARAISMDCHERMFRRLLHIGGVRSSTNDEPDPGWKSLLEALERLADQYKVDTELGPLFAEIAKHERAWTKLQHGTSEFDDDDG